MKNLNEKSKIKKDIKEKNAQMRKDENSMKCKC